MVDFVLFLVVLEYDVVIVDPLVFSTILLRRRWLVSETNARSEPVSVRKQAKTRDSEVTRN